MGVSRVKSPLQTPPKILADMKLKLENSRRNLRILKTTIANPKKAFGTVVSEICIYIYIDIYIYTYVCTCMYHSAKGNYPVSKGNVLLSFVQESTLQT